MGGPLRNCAAPCWQSVRTLSIGSVIGIDFARSSRLISSSFSSIPIALMPRLYSSSLRHFLASEESTHSRGVVLGVSCSPVLLRRYDLAGARTASTTEGSSPSSRASIANAFRVSVSSRIRASDTRALSFAWYSSSARDARSWPCNAWMAALISLGTHRSFEAASWHQSSSSTLSTASSARAALRHSSSTSSSCLSIESAEEILPDANGRPRSAQCSIVSAACAKS